MGAGLPVEARDYDPVKAYQALITAIQAAKMGISAETIQGFTGTADAFFVVYSHLTAGGRLNEDDLLFGIGQDGFSAVTNSFRALLRFLMPPVLSFRRTRQADVTFANDVEVTLTILTNALKGFSQVCARLQRQTLPAIYCQLGLEVRCFAKSFSIEVRESAPFYRLRLIPVYCLKVSLERAESKYVCLRTDHNTGKSHTIPLFLAIQAYSEGRRPFVFVIEHDPVLIGGLGQFFESIGSEDVTVMTSVDEAVRVMSGAKLPLFVCIVILTPLGVLEVLHRLAADKVTRLFESSRFLLDDIHRRSIETDVLIERVISGVRSSTSEIKGHFIWMSATPDLNLIRYAHRPQIITKNSPSLFEVKRDEVECETGFEISRLRALERTRKILNDWSNLVEGLPDPGGILVFLPGASLCHKFCEKLRSSFDHIPLRGRRAIFPLFTGIRHDDTSERFYRRITQEIGLLKVERESDIKKFRPPPLFFIPIFLTRHAKASALDIIRETIPATITDIVIRIIVTTGDLPTLAIPDLKVVIDTGIEEVQYYDWVRGLDYVQEEAISDVDREQRAKLVGQTDGGLAILFNAKNCVRPTASIPCVKRLDLSQSCLALWRLGYTFADMRNLPNEPRFELMTDCQEQFDRYGIVNERRALTGFGSKVVKFSFIRPLFAASVVKFLEFYKNDMNAGLFGCLIFYVIENSKDLIAVPSSNCFVQSFCADSDVVTLYSSLVTILSAAPVADEIETISQNGFNASFVLELRQILIEVHQVLSPGARVPAAHTIIAGMGSWVDHQKGKSLGLIDKLFDIVKEFNEGWFTVRTGKFKHVIGAGSRPAIVYNVRGFSEDKLVIEGRPGWKGLVAPGACYVLSIHMNRTTGVDSGLLIHRIEGDRTPGVISREVEPVLNSPFFIALVEAYLGDKTAQKFVGIEMGRKPNKKSAFLIHLTRSGPLTYLNYCPRTQDTGAIMSNAITLLRTLLPFVPRSILIKRDVPSLIVEMFSVGSSQYDTRLHLYEDASADVPVPYHVNMAVLDYVAKQSSKLADDVPAYRFAITGECVSYRTYKGQQVNLPLEPPNTSPTLTSVFDRSPSHLVLLVDNNQPAIPGQTRLPWVAAGGVPKVTGFVDQSDLLEIANEIVAVQGTATRQADFWMVVLNDNQLRVAKGEIPADLRVECGSTNGKDIACNFFDLVRIFNRRSISGERGLSQPIAVKELSSTETKKTKIDNRATFETAFCANLIRDLKVRAADIQFMWVGNEAFAIRIENLKSDVTRHPLPSSIDDQSYQSCQADAVIKNCVPKGCPISSVIHAPCTSVSINHYHGSGWAPARFERAVDEIREQYGFLVTCVGPYSGPAPGAAATAAAAAGKLGEMSIEICDAVVAVSLAQAITGQIPVDAGFDADALLTTTRTMAARNLAARRPPGFRGPEPKVGFLDSVRGIPVTQVDSMRSLVADRARSATGRSRWRLDENFRVLVVPVDEEEELRRLLIMLRRDEGRPLCLYECNADVDDPDDLIPQPTYVFNKDQTSEVVAMCRPCVQAILTMRVAGFFNPNTRTILQNKLAELRERLEPLPAEPSMVDAATHQQWPVIALGALVWAFMSDHRGVAAYTKAWVTGVAEATVRCAGNIFTNCPNHPQFLFTLPAVGQARQCGHCKLLLCGVCRTWHAMDAPCDKGEIAGAKRCPRCRTPVFKTSGCNHITCKCGCHWCYVCTQGFDTKDPCYTHMSNAHGGWFVNPWPK